MTAFAVWNGYVGLEISGVHLDGKVFSVAELRSIVNDHFCQDEGCDHHGTLHICRPVPADPWSTDLDAAPLDRKVLVCNKDGDYFVAVKSESLRNAFCYAVHRGFFLMIAATKWREIPA